MSIVDALKAEKAGKARAEAPAAKRTPTGKQTRKSV